MSSNTATPIPLKVVPAQLDFLAIYNPSLGTTDENLDQQIVYFSTNPAQKTRHRSRRSSSSKTTTEVSHDEKNERLRQIGLAQGMVEFGKSFSDGKSVDTIETEKSRIILHELEAGWWILASISLTQLPVTSKGPKTSKPNDTAPNTKIEHSSREVKPSSLLLQELLRAHSTFLLHHASSMSALFVRTRRSKFVGILERYWDSYLSVWNVLLHGNPAVNIYGGIKLAASGELGMGVGEEDRGSGEREVLEGFVGRVDGLIDLVVSKFGTAPSNPDAETNGKQTTSQDDIKPSQPWLGTGAEPDVEDGAIFLGVGALSRKSLRDVTHWVEDLYTWGPHAYGVLVNPTSTRRARRKKKTSSTAKSLTSSNPTETSALPDRSISIEEAPTPGKTSFNGNIGSAAAEDAKVNDLSAKPLPEQRNASPNKETRPSIRRALSSRSSKRSIRSTESKTGTGKFVSFLKMGYGTHWSLGGSSGSSHDVQSPDTEHLDPGGIPPKVTDLVPQEHEALKETPVNPDLAYYPLDDSKGHYLVGLLGDLDSEESGDEMLQTATADSDSEQETNKRTLLRTVTVELEREGDARAEADISIEFGTDDTRALSSKIGSSQHTNQSTGSYESQDRNKTKKLRVVVYIKRPFIYTFFFELRTESLAFATLYRSLHHQLGPLQRPLLASTEHTLSRPDISSTTPEATSSAAPIYDLIWDPKTLTVTSTIPNIPDPIIRSEDNQIWSRMEALSTHTQILSTYASTRKDRLELERTCKTSRGFWVVWARILDTDTPPPAASIPGSGKRTPSLAPEDSFDTVRGSQRSTTMHGSLYSGPAHPFLETPGKQEWFPKDKEIFLIRKASDYAGGKAIASSLTSGITGGYMESWGSSAPAKLAQGIGVDTKRYIEGLLNMGR